MFPTGKHLPVTARVGCRPMQFVSESMKDIIKMAARRDWSESKA